MTRFRLSGRRVALLALLALAVPLPAFALSGGDAAAQSLSVSASLGGCGLAETTIMCQINASWSALDDADYYTASVSGPDGSVTDFGSVGSGSASVYVPYVGDGSYSVQVTAWGEPVDPGEKPQIIARENSSSATATPQPGEESNPGESDPGRESATPETGSQNPAAPVETPGEGSVDPTTPTDPAEPTDPTITTPVEPTPVEPTPPPQCTTTTPDPAPTVAAQAGTSAGAGTGTDTGAGAEQATTPEPPPDPPSDPACG